ncbi:hypothetical protein DEO72_LG9g2142 [Vigna unguiculata]|uniref:Uncharacterized protein n=1 Tax=Vigna unguiculata TaxID=3917 RepID=A0A4D6N056_VIGUN|nr:hypothetical protein DEO72_LG9g2142 [Vigna unguiculata]
MLALVVDTSAHPQAAHPRAKCYKCYNESISLTHKRKQHLGTHPRLAPRSDWRVLLKREWLSLRRAPLRLGESSTKRTVAPAQSRLGEIPSPKRDICSLKTRSSRLGDHSCRKPWASLCTSRLGEASSPG